MRLLRSDVKTSIVMVIGLLITMLALVGVLALWQLNDISNTIQSIYKNNVIPLQQLRVISDGYAVTIVDTTNKYRIGAMDSPHAVATIKNAQAEIKTNWADYIKTYLVPKEKALVVVAEGQMTNADSAIENLLTAISADNKLEVDTFIRDQLYLVIEPVSKTMASLKDVQVAVVQNQLDKSQEEYRRTLFIAAGLSIFALIVSALLVLQLLSRFIKERNKAEASALRTSNLYSALARLNQTLPALSTQEDLVQRFCDFLTDVGGLSAAYIVLKQQGKSFIVGASGTEKNLIGTEILDKASGLVGDLPPYTLVPIYARHYVNTSDDGMDPSLLMSLAPHFGFKSSAMLNILRGGQVYGTINLYSNDIDFFDAPILRALDEASSDLSVLIDYLDAKVAQQLIENKANLHRLQFQQVFESSPLAMVLSTYPDNTVINANPAFCLRLGSHYANVVGRSMKSLGVKLNVEQEADFMKEIKLNSRVINYELVMQFDENDKRDVLVNSEILEFDGRACLLQVFNDISDRKRLIEAESANQAKTAFLSHLSHELKTPLNAVIGFAGFLKMSDEKKLTEKQLDSVNRIQSAGLHLNSIIADLIDIARIEAGQIAIKLEPVDVSECLSAAVSMCQRQANDAKITIQTPYMQQKLWQAVADVRRLQQVLINLVSNAIKYNREGGLIVLDVSQDKNLLQIKVQDNGMGMTETQMSQLFQPFNRLGQERSNIEGLGIGLSLSRQLTQLMGGEIQVISTKDQGSEFAVFLPLYNSNTFPS